MPLLDDFQNGVANIYGAGGPGDPLVALGMGLLSRRGVGPGMAQGFQNVATMTDLTNQRNRQASLDKLAQERETRQAAWQDWQRKQSEAEAARTQSNADRSFGLQQQHFQLQQDQANRPQLVEVPLPNGQKQRQWIRPGQEAGTPVGAPEASNEISQQIEQRKGALQAQGLDLNDPRNQQYVLTGKFPREDAQPLTPTDKKAILEADEMVQSNEQALDALGKASKVSPKAYSGFGASMRSSLGTGLPDYMVPDFIAEPQKSEATQDLNNIVVGNALNSLKSIFGGNPTEGERAILLELQGSASQPDSVRQKIYGRAVEMAKRRLEFNRKRAQELRGGTYYKPEAAPSGKPLPDAPAPSVSYPSWSIEK